jgi:hypothetical protein
LTACYTTTLAGNLFLVMARGRETLACMSVKGFVEYRTAIQSVYNALLEDSDVQCYLSLLYLLVGAIVSVVFDAGAA